MNTTVVSASASPDRNLLDRHQAAEYLGCSERTIRNYISEGHLRAYRIRGGRFLRIKLEDLDALLVPVPTVKTMGTSKA